MIVTMIGTASFPHASGPEASPPDPGSIAEHLPDAVLLVGTDLTVVWANQSTERLFGMTLAEASGRSGLEFIHPDDLQLAALSITSVRDKEVGSPIEVRIRSSDGWRLVEVIGAPYGDQLLLTMRDLTERRRWEVAGDEVALFRSLVQNAASITMLVGSDGIVEASSAALTRILGHDPEWMEGRSLVDLAPPEDRGVLLDALADITSPSAPRLRAQATVRLQHSDGSARPFALTIANLLDDPTVEGLVVSGHDVTDLVTAETELRAANSVLAATLEATADGILVVDGTGRITSSNSRFTELGLLGDNGVVPCGSLIGDVLACFEDPTTCATRIRELELNPELESHDVLTVADGRVVERDSRPQRIHGEVVGRVWSFRDITEHRRLEGELTHRAFHDSLTDLPNQALFRDRVGHAISRLRRSQRHVAVMFIDIDDFKTVNDSLGHTAGDDLLRVIAERLSVCLRPGDTVARLGGDEFAVLVEDTATHDETLAVAERINQTLSRPVRLEQRQLMMTASIGIAFGTAVSQCDDLLRNADLAMYHAKSGGKNCHRLYEPRMHEVALDRFELETDLRVALSRDQLIVQYQPIYDLESGRISAMEALVRWDHPVRGRLSPDQFILFAETSGLINELGALVLLKACVEASCWTAVLGTSRAPAVTVNLSPRQLLDPELAAWINEILDTSGLPASQLILEITENALMRDPEAAADQLRGLSELGIRLAVDDFGTGYSSLAYLQRFPIDLLKIDKAFTSDLESDRGVSLARAIVQLSRSLGMTPIAEGIETAENAAAVRNLGCALGQGFHLGRPLDAAEARTLLGISAG